MGRSSKGLGHWPPNPTMRFRYSHDSQVKEKIMLNYDLNKVSPNNICEIIQRDDEFRIAIADNMIDFGGSFVKALGECLLRADRMNRYKIAETWLEYILAYQPKHWRKKV